MRPTGWRLLDSALCLFVFFPSMLFYWRGTWDLYGVYFRHDDGALHCSWLTFGLGCGTIVGYLLQPALHAVLPAALDGDVLKTIVYMVTSRLCMYVHGVTAIAYSRGVWTLADYYLDTYFRVERWIGGVVGFVVCYSTLVVLRATQSVIFTPFVVTHDTRLDLLVPSTRFRSKVNDIVSARWSMFISNSF